MMKKILAIVLFAIVSASHGASDDLNDLLHMLQDNVFSVNVIGRIYDGGQVNSWEMDVAKYTISGRSVSLRLEGKDLIVIADITPYVDNEGGVLLVAQGQVWVDEPGEKLVKYSSTMKSLPINLGDKVYFYPLGIAQNYESEMFILELEIQILPYKNIAQSQPKQ